MSKALLVTTQDVKRYSILDGNVDDDKFKQYIAIAQDIHLQEYLGTDLLVKLQSLLPTAIDEVANANYKTLLETFVKPMLIHWALVEILPFIAYQVSNGGVFKHTPENTQTVDKNEVDFLVEKERNIAQNYSRRFIDFMRYNATDYPEYDSNTDEDVRPNKYASFGGWYLGNSSKGSTECSYDDFWGITK